jgi:N-acetylneuraminic acid mutarotase
VAAAALALMPLLVAAGSGPAWRQAAPLPVARTEVAAAFANGELVVVGGFTADGQNSGRVDAYSPARDRWRRLPDLPVAVDHAAAAAAGTRVYVAGGYAADRRRLRSVFVLEQGAWRRLPQLPAARAAAGAAVVGGRLYVVGGVGALGLARAAFALDLARRRWRALPAPTAREHLAVTALRGRIYALAGRTAGFDTNLRILESYLPGARAWRRLPSIPEARGGTGAAPLAGRIVSVGGEAPQGTIASVYAYDVADRRWLRLPDLPTPRHGLGVVAALGRIYAVGGGPQPGLHVSDANEFLQP